MFSYKTILFFLITILLFSCQPEGDPIGHWHLIDQRGNFFTIDILDDSTAIAGINSIHQDDNSLGDHNKEIKELNFHWDCGFGFFKYKVNGDKIQLSEYEAQGSKITGHRCNDASCCNKKEELFLSSKVDISLPVINNQEVLITTNVHDNNSSLKILFGQPKKDYREHYGENIVMQLNDKFSPITQLAFFIENKFYQDTSFNKENIHIDIIADENIPLNNIYPILKELKRLKMKNIWIGYYHENTETGSLLEYVSVNNFDFNSSKTLKEYIPKKTEAKEKSKTPKVTNYPTPKKSNLIHPDIIALIRQSSVSLSGTKYSIAKKTDCSGMFHKLLDSFKSTFPEYQFPTINNARSSRDIALWYHKNGNFQIIRDPKKSSNLIEPGMVMFYGYGGQKYDQSSLDMQQLITRGKGINHVAVVTQVNRKNGIVESYDIFHGRNPKHPASITTSRRIYPHRPNVPVYGNGLEPWLGIASIVTLQNK